eukprot:COSAG01_NODE_1299_length_10836_cov_8.277452_7_plen_93_part_00
MVMVTEPLPALRRGEPRRRINSQLGAAGAPDAAPSDQVTGLRLSRMRKKEAGPGRTRAAATASVSIGCCRSSGTKTGACCSCANIGRLGAGQ